MQSTAPLLQTQLPRPTSELLQEHTISQLIIEALVAQKYRTIGTCAVFLFLLSSLILASMRLEPIKQRHHNRHFLMVMTSNYSLSSWERTYHRVRDYVQGDQHPTEYCFSPSCIWIRNAIETLNEKPDAFCNSTDITQFCSLRAPIGEAERHAVLTFQKLMSHTAPYHFQLTVLQRYYNACLQSLNSYDQLENIISQKEAILDLNRRHLRLNLLMRYAAKIDIMFNDFSFFSAKWKSINNTLVLHIGPPIKSNLLDEFFILTYSKFILEAVKSRQDAYELNPYAASVQIVQIDSAMRKLWLKENYWDNVSIIKIPFKRKSNLTLLSDYFDELRGPKRTFRILGKRIMLEKIEIILRNLSPQELRTYLQFKLQLGLNISLAARLRTTYFNQFSLKPLHTPSTTCTLAIDYMLLGVSSIVTDVLLYYVPTMSNISKEVASFMDFTNEISGTLPKAGLVLKNYNVHVELNSYPSTVPGYAFVHELFYSPNNATPTESFFRVYDRAVSNRNRLLWSKSQNIQASIFSLNIQSTNRHLKCYSYPAFLLFNLISPIERIIYFGADLLDDAYGVFFGNFTSYDPEYLALQTLDSMMSKFMSRHLASENEILQNLDVNDSVSFFATLSKCHQERYSSLIKAYVNESVCL